MINYILREGEQKRTSLLNSELRIHKTEILHLEKLISWEIAEVIIYRESQFVLYQASRTTVISFLPQEAEEMIAQRQFDSLSGVLRKF